LIDEVNERLNDGEGESGEVIAKKALIEKKRKKLDKIKK